jgi:hypothetical protein
VPTSEIAVPILTRRFTQLNAFVTLELISSDDCNDFMSEVFMNRIEVEVLKTKMGA